MPDGSLSNDSSIFFGTFKMDFDTAEGSGPESSLLTFVVKAFDLSVPAREILSRLLMIGSLLGPDRLAGPLSKDLPSVNSLLTIWVSGFSVSSF